MSVDQVVTLLGAVTAVLVAAAAVIQRIESLRRALDGRLSQLIDAREDAARKQGELQANILLHQLQNPPPDDRP